MAFTSVYYINDTASTVTSGLVSNSMLTKFKSKYNLFNKFIVIKTVLSNLKLRQISVASAKFQAPLCKVYTYHNVLKLQI